MTLMAEFFLPSTYISRKFDFLVGPEANGWNLAADYSDKDCVALSFGGSQS